MVAVPEIHFVEIFDLLKCTDVYYESQDCKQHQIRSHNFLYVIVVYVYEVH